MNCHVIPNDTCNIYSANYVMAGFVHKTSKMSPTTESFLWCGKEGVLCRVIFFMLPALLSTVFKLSEMLHFVDW